jgi:hypothetical protein
MYSLCKFGLIHEGMLSAQLLKDIQFADVFAHTAAMTPLSSCIGHAAFVV